jgi:hypothetical protein
VRRVWVVDADGMKRGGTLWWVDGDSVQIRVDNLSGVTVLPVAARGKRWDFIESRGGAFTSQDVVYEGLSGSARSGAVGEAER